MLAELSRVDRADVLELRIPDLGGMERAAPSADPLLELRHTEDPTVTARVPGTLHGDHVRADLGGVELRDGCWDVLWVGPDDVRTPITTRDPGYSVSERRAYLESPRWRELRTVRGARGQLWLRCATVIPYAEVTWVSVGADGGTVTVWGRLAYAPWREGTADAQLVARQRELSGLVTGEAEVNDHRFRCDIPLGPVVEAHDPRRPHNEWDLWLHTLWDGADLRLGTHADDITGKKSKMVYPQTRPDGGTIEVLPYYTVEDELSLLAREADQS